MCDSIVAAREQTRSGVTLYGKNSDRKPGECQPFLQFPEAHHPPGSSLRCTHIEIPQVAETYRVMGHSPWWIWGFEHGVNEHAVAVGNHTVFSNESIEESPGLIGMDLVRLALERGRTARESLEVVASLVERHGQGGAALAPGAAGYHNSFVLADPEEAWHLETSNRHWVARRMSLGAASNHFSIGSDWDICSRDFEAFAREAGFWEGPGRVDAARAYRNPHVPAHISEGRHSRALALLASPPGAHDAESFARILRDHGEGGPLWTGADATPNEQRFFTLCAHSSPVYNTTASLIAPLPEDRSAPWPVWISFGTPCSGIFLPVYLHGALPGPLAQGGPEPEPGSAWWVFEALQSAAAANPPACTAALREGWSDLERFVESQRLEADSQALAEIQAGDPDAAAERLSAFMQDSVGLMLERAEQLRARIS